MLSTLPINTEHFSLLQDLNEMDGGYLFLPYPSTSICHDHELWKNCYNWPMEVGTIHFLPCFPYFQYLQCFSVAFCGHLVPAIWEQSGAEAPSQFRLRMLMMGGIVPVEGRKVEGPWAHSIKQTLVQIKLSSSIFVCGENSSVVFSCFASTLILYCQVFSEHRSWDAGNGR